MDNVHKQTTVIEPAATSSSTGWVRRMLNQLNGADGRPPDQGVRRPATRRALRAVEHAARVRQVHVRQRLRRRVARQAVTHCIWCVDIDMCVQGSPDAGPDSVGKIALISKSVRCERWLAHAI